MKYIRNVVKYFSASVIVFVTVFQLGCSSSQESVKNVPLEEDRKLGLQVVKEIESKPSEYPVLSESQYPAAYQHIRRITTTILNGGAVKNRAAFEWKVSIIKDDKTLNAFCTPGGYIYVYTGIIKYLDSEDQLAGVLGHEIAHADCRHSQQQQQSAQKTGILATLADLGGRIFFGTTLIGTAANVGANLALLNYSREDETEADINSVHYLYNTEYDARGAARFFEKMVKAGNGGGPVFMSTHPDPGNRVQKITAEWQKMGGKTGQTFSDRYKEIVASLPK